MPSSFRLPRAPAQWQTFPLPAKPLRMIEDLTSTSQPITARPMFPHHLPALRPMPQTPVPWFERLCVRNCGVVLPEQYHPSFDATPPDISLKEAIRDEVHATLSDLPKPSCWESLRGALTDGVATLCDFRQLTLNVVASYSKEQREPNRVFVAPPHYRCDQLHPYTLGFSCLLTIPRQGAPTNSSPYASIVIYLYMFTARVDSTSMTSFTPTATMCLVDAIAIDFLPKSIHCSSRRDCIGAPRPLVKTS